MGSYNATEVPSPIVFSSYGERQLIAAFYGIVAIVGALGNCLVLLSVLLSRKLRTVPNMFVVNLSLADLISNLSMPWQAVAVLSMGEWPLPNWVCAMGAVGVLVPIGCSLNTLTLIGINRFVLVTRAKATYQRLYRTQWVVLMVSAAWLFPMAITSIPLVSGFVELGFDGFLSTCGWDTSHPNSPKYALLVAIASYPVQLCTIIACYVALFVRLCKHNRAVFNAVGGREQPAASGVNSVSGAISVAALARVPQLPRHHKVRQLEVTKNLFFVVCAFFVCITPYAICIMRTDSYRILPYATVLLFANSCLNPFIYAVKHSDFRKAFVCILRCEFGAIPGRINICS